jgi:hypothetical protein
MFSRPEELAAVLNALVSTAVRRPELAQRF